MKEITKAAWCRALQFRWLSISLLLVLAGCQQESTITLRLANWADYSEAKIVDGLLREFERQHPGVKVVQESYPNQFREKILTSFAAGAPPDVFLLDSGDVPTFVEPNLLVDLSPYLDRVGFDPDDYYPNVLAIAQRGEQLYAFPKDFTPMVIYYNRQLLRENGIAEPQPNWTWDDFVAKCQALTRDFDDDGHTDQYGTFFLRFFYLYQPFIWLNGGDVLSPDGTHASGYLDSPETIATFRFLIDWHTRWGFTAPLDIKRNPSHRQRNMFYLGRAGFLVNGHWWLPELRQYIAKRELDIGIVGLPRVPGKAYANIMYESGWAVSVLSRHRKYAVQLAAFMAGEEAQRRTWERGLAIPAMKRIAEEAAAADTTGFEAVFLAEIPHVRQPWGTRIARFATIEDYLKQIFDRVVWGSEALEPVVRDVAQKIDALLAERRLQQGS